MTKITIAVDPNSIVIPKKRSNQSASEHRKITKPIMEKKRRARINKSLEQIKDILKENFNECSKKNQLEKADILELTVKYLHMVTKNQILKHRNLSESKNNLQNVNLQLIQNGFQNCKQEVGQYFSRINQSQLNQNLQNHLANFERKFESMEYDEDQVLNLSIHPPHSPDSVSSNSHFDYPNSSPSTPSSNSERSMSPIDFTANHYNQSLWRPW